MLSSIVAVLVYAQAGAGQASDAARAAAAAEKAAQAAAVAAEAAQKAAEAASRLAAAAPAKPEGPAAQTPAPPPAPPPASRWNGTIGLGLISLTGNAHTVTFNTNAAAEWKSDGWTLGAKINGVYGQNRVSSSITDASGNTVTFVRDDTVAEAAGVQLRVDRRFAERYGAYVLVAADTDHVKSVELRSTGEVGATIMWVDSTGSSGSKTTLRTDLGFRVAHERRHEYFPRSAGVPDETLYAPRAGLAFKYALSKDVLFTEDAEILPNVVGEGRVVVNSISKISTRLSKTLAFGVAFTVNHDSRPAKDKLPTDTSLALTLDVLL